ncbi:MAG: thiamine phosphate synthase [Alphaproteobacteria bacterium]|nr:thiamine phosphate synthase [Alphaproteobacteria bacterium]
MRRLLPITPGDPTRDLRADARALAQAGCDALLLREPERDPADVLALAEDLRALLPGLIVHARCPGGVDVAQSLGAPLHLPAWMDLRATRERFDGPVGISTHAPDQARDAFSQGAAWVLLSPAFAPLSKPDDRRPPLGLQRILQVQRAVPGIVFALGGLTPERAGAAWRMGIEGVAALGGVFGDDPAATRARAAAYIRQQNRLD